MKDYEQFLIAKAAETQNKLRAFIDSDGLNADNASLIGECRAVIKILSDALASHHEPAL